VEAVPPSRPGQITISALESIHLGFETATLQLEPVRYGRGGGLTVLDGNAILVTVDGRISLSTGPQDLQPLAIAVPAYGFEAFRAFARAPENADYLHSRWGFRYADILAFRRGGRTWLALSFTRYEEGPACIRTEVALLEIPPDPVALRSFRAAAGDWRTVLRTEPCLPLAGTGERIQPHMVGGRLAFDGRDTLYVTSGDYGLNGLVPGSLATPRDPAYDYGKVLAVDLATGTRRQVSLGHRNQQGIAFDRDGALWASEHGPRGGDELNLILEGRDYGWPQETLGTLYNRLPVPGSLGFGRHDSHEPPRYAFLPSVGVSSLALIDGFHPAWDGDLLLATLKDRALYRIRRVDGHVQFAERIPVGERIRDAEQLDGERLVLFTDDQELVFLTRKDNTAALEVLTEYLARPDLDRQVAERLDRNVNGCLQCHSLDPHVNTGAPSLARVFGAPLAATAFDGYSEGLRRAAGSWTRERLAAWIDDPAAMFPGTSMPDPGIDDPAEIEALVDFLAALALSGIEPPGG
jgi:cytochrome c2